MYFSQQARSRQHNHRAMDEKYHHRLTPRSNVVKSYGKAPHRRKPRNRERKNHLVLLKHESAFHKKSGGKICFCELSLWRINKGTDRTSFSSGSPALYSKAQKIIRRILDYIVSVCPFPPNTIWRWRHYHPAFVTRYKEDHCQLLKLISMTSSSSKIMKSIEGSPFCISLS